jgi:hypothetical protein
MDRSGTEDTCQFTAGVILSNLQMMEKSFLFDVSEPHLRCVRKNGKNDADKDFPPRKEGETADRVT